MGQISILTSEQKIILDEIKKNNTLKELFYFTGGTALSLIYLKHRYSEDLDFFTQATFDTATIVTLLKEWSKAHHFTFRSQTSEFVLFCTLNFSNKRRLKIDFARYPYKPLEKGNNYCGFQVDSLLDIAVNKLSLLSQRAEVKDFVDLYFLLQQFSIWDLIEGARIKFNMEIEPFILAADFTNAEDFKHMPKMIKPLILEELKSFFRTKAKELGKKVVE